jgi:hypothetical protein
MDSLPPALLDFIGCSPLGVYLKMAQNLNKIKVLGGARGAVF